MFCDKVYIRPEDENDASLSALKYADERRLRGEFVEAEISYRRFLEANVENYSARWGLLLCKYGVINEPNSEGKWVPTCRRHEKNLHILNDEDYFQLLKDIPPQDQESYREKADYIDRIHKEIDRIEEERTRSKGKSWEIFLCFTERDGQGRETPESQLARSLYDELKKKYSVFYPPEAFRGKNDIQQEAAISDAVESAQMMLIIGFNPASFADSRTHSLYARYKQKMRGTERMLIPIYTRKADLPKDLPGDQGIAADEKRPDRKALMDKLADSLLKLFTVRCPECQSPLARFNGRIGYCPEHHWVSPKGFGFDAEAHALNVKEEEEEKERRKREEEERKKKEEEQKRRAEARRKALKKAVLAAAALVCVGAIGFFWFVIRPEMNYNQAGAKFTLGDYPAARKEYGALGNYKDALARTVLCDAMIDLQEGRAEDTVKKLDQLTADGMEEITSQLADALRPVIAGWRAKGVTPSALLLLLTKADIIDPEGTLNVQDLSIEGHKALLDADTVSAYAEDLNNDGLPDLAALDGSYRVTVYRMDADRNVRMAVDNEILAACQLRFGEQMRETDEDAAVACCAEAYRLVPNDETRAALIAAYRFRAISRESAKNIAGAVTDAENAMKLSGQPEDFAFFYDLNLRVSKSAADTAGMIAAWDRFAEDYGADLTRFGARENWEQEAAALRLSRASELALAKDPRCIDEIRSAYGLGADVSAAIDEAAVQVTGLALAGLRLLEMETAQNDAAAETVRAQLDEDVRTAVSQWKSQDIDPQDVPALIRLADEQQISLQGIPRASLYREAALASAGSAAAQSVFTDWDQDGYEELLCMDAEGTLRLYGLSVGWGVLASMDTKLPGGSFAILDSEVPLLLILSQKEDELQVLSAADNHLRFLFNEAGITRCSVNGAKVAFSRELEGSIPRYSNYLYEAVSAASRPERTDVDWQQARYPYPETAEAAIQRYLEAMAYQIPEEAALLTGEESDFSFFRMDGSSALAALMPPVSVSAVPYCELENAVLLRVDFTAGNMQRRVWAAAENAGGWKISGFSDTFAAAAAALPETDEAKLLGLNLQETGAAARGEINRYRLLVPSSGALTFVWYGAEKEGSSSAYHVTLHPVGQTQDLPLDIDLPYTTGTRYSEPLFVQPGAYELILEALISKAPEYRMSVAYEPMAHIETERNDSVVSAVPIEADVLWRGRLDSKNDVDYYSFELTETSTVNAVLTGPGTGRSSVTLFNCAILDSASGVTLCPMDMAGNQEKAETGNLYLGAGAYLIRIAKGSSYTGAAYGLTLQVSPAVFTEAERNDTLSSANRIPVDTDVTGATGVEGDVDCFAFTLDHDVLMRPRFTFPPMNSSSRAYRLTLMDQNRTELYRINVNGKEYAKEIDQFPLPAGSYYLKVESVLFVRQDYVLRIETQAVEAAEREPNSTAAQATELKLNQTYTGLLWTEEDVDYYKASFQEDTAVTLKFAFPEGTQTTTSFTLSIEQNGKAVKINGKDARWNVKENTGGFEAELRFPAGDYYIPVKPSSWTNAVYTIQLAQ